MVRKDLKKSMEETEMSVSDILERKPLIFDGAMGTCFAEKKPGYAEPCELAGLDHPDIIKDIHRSYLQAGCDAIKTNTFQVNPLNEIYAADPGLLRKVIEAGWKNAVDAAGDSGAEIFADLGPVPAGSRADRAEKAAAFTEVCRIFLECGAVNFLFETQSSDEGLAEAASFIKEELPEAFIAVSFAVQPDGYTRDGMYVSDLAERMSLCEAVDAVGLNCVSSALHMKGLAESMIETLTARGKLMCVMPNAGYPKVIGSRVFYDSDPRYFAEQTAGMISAGASIAGGCCGTNADHIKALAEAASAAAGGRRIPARVRPLSVMSGEKADIKPELLNEYNLFSRKLESGRRVIAVELDPPRNADSAKYMSGAWSLKAAGVDAITIADCATGRASMDSSIMACKLRRELGIDAIPHMTCRDRNLNAIKALLMALSTEGVSNILAITGDPVPSAERDEVKSVFQFNSRMFASYISSLNRNEFVRPMRIFGALNVNVKNFDRELDRTVKKVENGMTGFLTQPVLTEAAAENLHKAYERLRPLGAKVLGGIIPVVSSRNARFMNSEISGITVDQKIIDLYEGKTKDECTELAVDISSEIAKRIAGFTDGYYLMTPFSRTDIMTRIIAGIREMTTDR